MIDPKPMDTLGLERGKKGKGGPKKKASFSFHTWNHGLGVKVGCSGRGAKYAGFVQQRKTRKRKNGGGEGEQDFRVHGGLRSRGWKGWIP